MSKLSLAFGGCDYWDRTRPLMDGTVQPEGVDLKYTIIPPADLGRRVIAGNEFEAAEIYACSYIMMLSSGDDRFVGLPVFPSRSFRHDCNVPPSAVHWFEGGMWSPDDFFGHATAELPPDIRVSQAGERTLEDMILEGDLDALISPHRPRALVP